MLAATLPQNALVSDDFLTDPYPVLSWLRTHQPVHWSDAIGGWVVTRYDDVVVTMKDTDTYSNEGRLGRAMDYLPSEAQAQLTAFRDHYRTKGLLHSDPPDHTRLRSLVNKAFTPRMVDAMRPRIQHIVDELIDGALSSGGMEVIQQLAFALPVTVLADIVGAPSSDYHYFQKWADSLLAFQGVNKPDFAVLLQAQAALVEARAYLADLIALRRVRPGEDLVSKLVAVELEGERLTEDELLNTCITLLVAGHETTTSLIGNGLLLFLQHPEQWQMLKQDRSLLPAAIEEVLRYESPVARQPRVIRREAELAGAQLQAGQMLFQMLNSANRDAEHFENPDVFDIRRVKNRHIAFGFGVHFCIGAPLSRAEGLIVFDTILRRLPDIRLVDQEAHWDVTKRNSRVLKSLHVEF
jgi:pimeloyl-[acyl-carrier protein] synthase